MGPLPKAASVMVPGILAILAGIALLKSNWGSTENAPYWAIGLLCLAAIVAALGGGTLYTRLSRK